MRAVVDSVWPIGPISTARRDCNSSQAKLPPVSSYAFTQPFYVHTYTHCHILLPLPSSVSFPCRYVRFERVIAHGLLRSRPILTYEPIQCE